MIGGVDASALLYVGSLLGTVAFLLGLCRVIPRLLE